MEISQIIPHIEALVFASDKALNANDITELINTAFGFLEERISLEQVEAALEGIQEKYSTEYYPFELKQSGGGWQFLTKPSFHSTIAQLNGDKFLKRLSNAALESLAIIAYKQPITKGEVEAIRGVNSDYSMQKLLEKELIVISGRNELLPGKPLIYSTSRNFMDYFGINSTEDLPKIREVLADQIVEATVIKPEDFTDNSVFEQTADALAEENEQADAPNAESETGDFTAESNEEDYNPESPVA
jgi:segregation and condensation protein B